MGFTPYAYRGFETGSRHIGSHVVRNNNIVLILSSPLKAPTALNFTLNERQRSCLETYIEEDMNAVDEKGNPITAEERELRRITAHLVKHGDAVYDVAFQVDDCATTYNHAVQNGAISVQKPITHRDEFGSVTTATIRTYGDTVHTLIQTEGKYKSQEGCFLPGYKLKSPEAKVWEQITELQVVDHCVGNMDWDGMDEACDFYAKTLNFHRFWSIDDATLATEFSSLSSTVMASSNEKVKMPINEPAVGKKKSQIEEYVEYNGNTPGVQHIALRTNDIVSTVSKMKQRGVEFIQIPEVYYEVLQDRLKSEGCENMVTEDWAMVKKLGIMVDFDKGGYLLQLFTKPLMDRPTVFIEIIQRHNFEGFGAGNFKSLFQAIEREQAARGNL